MGGKEHCHAITLHSGKHVEVKEKLEAKESKLMSSRVPNLNMFVGYCGFEYVGYESRLL